MFAAVLVGLFAGLFVYLGFWQLDRLQQKIEENAVATARLAIPAEPLAALLAELNDHPSELEYRRATVDGFWMTAEEVLVRSQVHQGTAGFHVITPLEYDGKAVLVNRGWVPLTLDQTPIADASPSDGTVEGWIHLTQTRGLFGPEDASGAQTAFSRVDVARIQQEVSLTLDDVYLVQTNSAGEGLPFEVDIPDFADEGPHLAYAIQWFGFALIAVVGFVALIRKKSSS